MRLISKSMVDYGNFWQTHFTAFDFLNVEFQDEDNPFDRTERVRRHTMSSISKQRNASLSDIMERDKLRAELSAINADDDKPRMSLRRISDPKSVNKSEQGGVTVSPTARPKDELDLARLSPEVKVGLENSPENQI